MAPHTPPRVNVVATRLATRQRANVVATPLATPPPVNAVATPRPTRQRANVVATRLGVLDVVGLDHPFGHRRPPRKASATRGSSSSACAGPAKRLRPSANT